MAVLLPWPGSPGVTVLAGSDITGTVAGEIAWLHRLGLTIEEALDAAGPSARRYLDAPDEGDLATYEDDPARPRRARATRGGRGPGATGSAERFSSVADGLPLCLGRSPRTASATASGRSTIIRCRLSSTTTCRAPARCASTRCLRTQPVR